jgi:hypothetical protein
MKIAAALTMLAVLWLVTMPRPAATGERTRTMSRASLDSIELEYEVRGTGEPVVLVHAGVFARWYQPLLDEPALVGRYRVLTYHRIGYAGSSRLSGPVSISRRLLGSHFWRRHAPRSSLDRRETMELFLAAMASRRSAGPASAFSSARNKTTSSQDARRSRLVWPPELPARPASS